jgi:hypothetical protein
MRLTKNEVIFRDTYTPKSRLRGGPSEYFVAYTRDGEGLAFTSKEIEEAHARFTKLDEGDPGFPHQWTFWRWLVGVVSGRR